MKSWMLAGVILMMVISCSSGPKLPPIPPDGVVLAFGDSLTYGTGAAEGYSYPEILEKLTGRRVIRSGVPGEVTAEGLLRLERVLDTYRPALLLLCHGGNDLLQRHDQQKTADNLRSMIRMAQQRKIPVLLIAVPALGFSLDAAPFYAQIAGELNIPLDGKALPRVLGQGKLKSDYVHPNAAGYRKLAEDIAASLKKFGALP